MLRNVVIAIAASVSLVGLLGCPSVGAADTWGDTGRYWSAHDPAASGAVQCANWRSGIASSSLFFIDAATRSYRGSSGNCTSTVDLPARFVRAKPTAYWFTGKRWELYVNPTSSYNSSGGSRAYGELETLYVPTGYWYLRGIHETLQLGGDHYYVSGSGSPVVYYCNRLERSC